MVLHLPAAPHDVAPGGVEDAVAGAARDVHGLQDVDMVTRHLAVPDQEAGRRQGGQAAAYDVGALFLHALGLPGPCEGFVVAVGVVDSLAVLFVLAQLRVAVIFQGCAGDCLPLGGHLSCLMLLCRYGGGACACRDCCCDCEFFVLCHYVVPSFLILLCVLFLMMVS